MLIHSLSNKLKLIIYQLKNLYCLYINSDFIFQVALGLFHPKFHPRPHTFHPQNLFQLKTLKSFKRRIISSLINLKRLVYLKMGCIVFKRMYKLLKCNNFFLL